MADIDDEQHEDVSINTDKVSEDINNVVRQKLGPEKWNPKKVDGWTKDIIETTLKSLGEMKKPFKYIVTCVIMQRTGAGLTSSFSALWDNMRDGAFAVPFDNENLHCVTTVYWVKLD